MKNETYVLKLDASYKVKHENYDSFKTSFFRDVYNQAACLVRDIVNSREEVNYDYNIQNDYTEPTSNTIAFMGKRGSGKTSAMLSFCDFLKNIKSIRQSGDMCKSLLEIRDNVSFTVLNCIDATLLDNSRELVGAILGNMLVAIKEKERADSENGKSKSIEIRKLKERLGEIYRSLILTMNKEDDIAPGEILEQLSRSWNQQQAFREAVRKFNTYMVSNREKAEKNFLVIPIDDVDMNLENGYQLLEVIRKYLMGSNVIVLLAADSAVLNSLCIKHYKKEMPKKTKKREIGKLATEYLEKILPTGRKLYMPNLQSDMSFGEKNILIEREDGIKEPIKKMIIESIWECTCIILDKGGNESHWLQPDSLRKLSNYYNEIYYLKDHNQGMMKEKVLTQNIKWLYDDIINRHLSEKLLGSNDAWEYERIVEMNNTFQNTVKEHKLEKLMYELDQATFLTANPTTFMNQNRGNSYGCVIAELYRDLKRGEDDLASLMAMILSLYMRKRIAALEFLDEDKEDTLQNIEDFTKGDYWGDYDYDILVKGQPGTFDRYGNIRNSVGVIESEIRIFESPLEGWDELDYILLAIQFDFKKLEDKIKGTFRFGNFINVIFHYEERMKEIIEIYDQSMLPKKNKVLIKKAGLDLVEQFENWENRKQTRRVVPFDSVEWMLSLYDMLYGENGIFVNNMIFRNYSGKYERAMNAIQSNLRGYDSYFQNVKEKNMSTKQENMPEFKRNYEDVFSDCPFIKAMRDEGRLRRVIDMYSGIIVSMLRAEAKRNRIITTQDD